MTENPPSMVLTEETLDRVTFRFQGKGWAGATLIPGIILVSIVMILFASGNSSRVMLAIVGLLGMALIYSSVYSLTSTQWLTADANTKKVHFYKKNIYGLVDWERPASEFKEIRVWRSLRATNWAITLVCNDNYRLQIGENVFGAFTFEKALIIAQKVSRRTNIKVNAHPLLFQDHL